MAWCQIGPAYDGTGIIIVFIIFILISRLSLLFRFNNGCSWFFTAAILLFVFYVFLVGEIFVQRYPEVFCFAVPLDLCSVDNDLFGFPASLSLLVIDSLCFFCIYFYFSFLEVVHDGV